MSSQDNHVDWSTLDAGAVDRIWDAMQRQIAPIGGRTSSAVTEVADAIRALEQQDDAPLLDVNQADAIWATVATATFAGPAVASPSSESTAAPIELPNHSKVRYLLDLAQSAIRQTAIGAMAGVLVGTLVLGGGSRLLMRVAAILSDAQAMGVETENGNTVGAITLDGTLALLFFVGAMFGLIAGIVVMAVRPWLPATGPMRLLATGAIGFAVAAPVVLEGGENSDYRRFGILGLNVCLFTALPFFFGLAVLPVIDWLDKHISSDLPGVSRGWWDVPKSLAMILLAIPAIQLVVSAAQLSPMGLLLLLPVIRVLWPIWAERGPTLEIRAHRTSVGMRVGRAALLLPCLLGLLLMARSVERLMT